ncbi:MAG: hypothetical protein ACRDRH_14515 [Pseudonocardia sp.]
MTDKAEQRLLAHFCAELARLRALLRGPASLARREVVEQAVRAARHGEPIGPWLAEMGLEVEDSNSTPTGGDATRSLPTRVPEVDLPPVTGVYLCPRQICGRIEVRPVGTEVPTCDVHEQALRFVPDGSDAR